MIAFVHDLDRSGTVGLGVLVPETWPSWLKAHPRPVESVTPVRALLNVSIRANTSRWQVHHPGARIPTPLATNRAEESWRSRMTK
jgi:hypothetical protein